LTTAITMPMTTRITTSAWSQTQFIDTAPMLRRHGVLMNPYRIYGICFRLWVTTKSTRGRPDEHHR
jgi:hypothetical protein